MKNLRTGIYFAIVAIFYFTSSVNAQNALYREPDYNKPKFFDAYPIEIRWIDFVIVAITVMTIGYLASLLPSLRAAKVSAFVRQE